MTELSGTKHLMQHEKEQIAAGIEMELEQWVAQIPGFLQPNQRKKAVDTDFYRLPWLLKRLVFVRYLVVTGSY